MKQMLVACLILISTSVMVRASDGGTNVIGTNTTNIASGPDLYADGTQILDGEKYYVTWTFDGVSTRYGPFAAVNGCLPHASLITKLSAAEGTVVVTYSDTRNTATTLGDYSYATYTSANATIASVAPSIFNLMMNTTEETRACAEFQAASEEDVIATAATVKATLTTNKQGDISYTVSSTSGNRARVVVTSSTDLKNWSIDESIRSINGVDIEIKIDPSVPTKFFRTITK